MMGKVLAGSISIVGWLSLILQFVLAMTNPVVPEPGVAERFVRFFSYFTVSTNIIVAVTLSSIAYFPQTKLGKFFSRPSVQTAVASYITLVGIVYSLFLRGTWNPQGWQAAADNLLHDAIPLAFVIYWFVFVSKDGIAWIEPVKWLIYPAVYIVYSLIRGAIVSWYPYWFVDVEQLGYSAALTNTAFVFVAFAAFGFIYVAFAKLLSRPAIQPAT